MVMSIPIEALAMAGVDYIEWGMDIEDWERDDGLPPPHLLADVYEEEEEEEFTKRHVKQGCSININSSFPCYNQEDDDNASEGSVTEFCYPIPGVFHEWRNTTEKIWLYFMPIVKRVLTMIKLLIVLMIFCR